MYVLRENKPIAGSTVVGSSVTSGVVNVSSVVGGAENIIIILL